MPKNEYRRGIGTKTGGLMALTTFPEPPKFFLPLLWEYAFAKNVEFSDLAKMCLQKLPDIRDQLVAKLMKGKAGERGLAARWLTALDPVLAKDVLPEALKNERTDHVKVAIIDCLDELGFPEDVYLDIPGLLKDAEVGLKKGIPSQLDWFPFTALPIVQWKDTGESVDPNVITWFIVQSFKLKDPEPSSLLKRYCDHMERSSREKLGQFVLDQWMARDTIPNYSPQELQEKAQESIARMKRFSREGTFNEQYQYAKLIRTLNITEIKGSALKEKGILAIVAACGGGKVVRPVGEYLKKFYGYRASQCKALIAMLSWIDLYDATQLLLRTSEGFRTAGIRKEAGKYVQLMAERHGWTIAELQDRTLPTGGFDENRTLVIDYGPRTFTVSLTDDLKLMIKDDKDKILKNLPKPGKSDDDELAPEGKRLFTSAKKAVSSIKKGESSRLHEAMCSQRNWTFMDWDRFLNRHPIMSHLCQRVVWGAFENNADESAWKTFRPLDDHSLTNEKDDPVELDAETVIRVAHTITISEEIRMNWIDHFKDYKLKPLLDQFSSSVFELEDEPLDQPLISKVGGININGLVLSGSMKKMGYVGGPKNPGESSFTRYVKKFPSSDIEVNIQFTGHTLYLMDDDVMLGYVYFTRFPNEGENEFYNRHRRILLKDVSRILLSETLMQLETLAGLKISEFANWKSVFRSWNN